MSKKKILGAVTALGVLAALDYRRHKATESMGWFADAPLTDTVDQPIPSWLTVPKTPLEALKADLYIARSNTWQRGYKLRRQLVDSVYLANGYGQDFPVSNYPEEKLSPELVADLRAWAAHYQQHATDFYESLTSEWDSAEALERHLRDEEQLYVRLRAEIPFWRRITHAEAHHVVVGRRGAA